MEYCPAENMFPDLMTKGLTPEKHERLLGSMGAGIPCEQTAPPSQVEEIGCHSMEITSESEELRNSHGGMARMPTTGVGASYLCYSNCDGSYSNCNEIKCGVLIIAGADHSGCGG